MNKLIISLSVTLLTLAMVTSTGLAKGKKSGPKPTPAATTISNVGPASITVTDQNGARTLTISQFTEITVNGQRGALADLRPGMTVSLTLKTPTEASKVSATSH
jgi:hypothetical protein